MNTKTRAASRLLPPPTPPTISSNPTEEIHWENLISEVGDIAAFQVIPHVFSATARYMVDVKQYRWYYISVRRPFWDIFGRYINPCFTLLHTALGLASYLVYKSKSGGWVKVVPITLCGTQLLFDAAWRPLYFNTKNWDRTLRHTVACSVLSTAVYKMYSGIDSWAGYLTLAYPCWWAYLTSVVWYVRLANDPPEPWRRLSFGGFPMMRRPTVPRSRAGSNTTGTTDDSFITVINE